MFRGAATAACVTVLWACPLRAGLLSVPADYTPEKSWPVIVAYQDNPSIEQMKTVPYFLVHAGGRGVEVTAKTRQYLKHLAGRYNIDPLRIYGSSFSRGGHELLQQAWQHPHWFAAIAPVCNDLRAEPKVLNVKYLLHTPTLLLHGTGDSFLQTGRRVHQLMKAAGCNVEFRTYPGGHSPLVPFRKNVKMLTEFFDKHRLDPYPKRIVHLVSHKRYSRAFWVDSTPVRDAGGLGAVFRVHVKKPNRIEVEANERIASLDLYLNDKIVDMSKPLTVTCGGKVLYSGASRPRVRLKLRDGETFYQKRHKPLWEEIQEIRRKAGAAATRPAARAPVRRKENVVRLKALADAWVSSFPGEEDFSAGRHGLLKLKTIQEMALIRFDAAPGAGRKVLAARLFLRRSGKDMLRYVRVSTVNAAWNEGTRAGRLGPGDGATYNHADRAGRRPWAFPGSQLCDVIMGSGNTLTTWAERTVHEDGWISVKLTAELIYAMVAGDTDGLAVMDGGTPAFANNHVHSVQSRGSEPYIEVTLGERLPAAAKRPDVRARPAPERSGLRTGAIAVTIGPAAGAFCWRVELDGKPVPRWRVPHPADGPTTFCLDELAPAGEHKLKVTAVSAGGRASEASEVRVTASPALPPPPALPELEPPKGTAQPPKANARFRLWACPGLVKIGPETGKVMFDDVGGQDPRAANAVWRNGSVRLFGARGEYVSFQLVVERVGPHVLKDLKVVPAPLKGPGGARIAGGEIELYKNWYARNADGKWQPAYCVPLKHGQALEVPDPARKLAGQRNQTITVDVYVPTGARPGRYGGSVKVTAAGAEAISLPVSLEVFDFALPDTLCFWPQLNSYTASRHMHDLYRLAHRHRSVFFYRNWRPGLTGAGKGIRVVWDEYDRLVGPLLSGKAFKDCRRAGAPIEAMSLPFYDSWPTPLTPRTYDYRGYWPQRGDAPKHLVAHYRTAPYIADALGRAYRDAFAAVQRQFIEHFRRKGWNRTEMQCLFVGKNTHRTQYGVNMWWTTDEPYHWDDWLALRYFGRLWRGGRREGERRQWVFRGDISRPQWQGRVLDGAIDTAYFGTGAIASPAMVRRVRRLARLVPLTPRVYGSASRDNASNLGSVAWILNAYLLGAGAALPWQAMGNDRALDVNDRAVGGNALLAPGGRFGVPVVADMRLKAFRDAQQLAEYLRIAARRYGLRRAQLRAMVTGALPIRVSTRPGAGADNADAMVSGKLTADQLSAFRRALALLIAKKP